MAEREVLALSQEMTISHADLIRGLPAAVDQTAFSVDASGIRSLDPAQRWRIAVVPLPDLCIGRLRLPRQRVEVFLSGYDDGQSRRFLQRFELCFRRAGG